MRLMKELMKSPKKPKPQLREAAKKTSWDILRGDKVQVIGKHPEQGKQGVVKRVNRKTDRVVVEGVNMRPRRIKGDQERGIKGLTVQREQAVHYSKVNLVDPVTGLPTRVTRKILESGEKVRVAKRSGAVIPRPEILSIRKRPVNATVTESCTPDAAAWEITYIPNP